MRKRKFLLPITYYQQCPACVRKGGTVVLFGGAKPGTTATFDTRKIHYDEITVKGVYHHTPEYIKQALDFVGDHGKELMQMITTTLPLDRTEEALRMMAERKALKVEITSP